MKFTNAMIGKKIREARKRAGLTQVKLAQLMGVTQSMVAHWEKGRSDISLIDFLRLADVTSENAAAMLDPAYARQEDDRYNNLSKRIAALEASHAQEIDLKPTGDVSSVGGPSPSRKAH